MRTSTLFGDGLLPLVFKPLCSPGLDRASRLCAHVSSNSRTTVYGASAYTANRSAKKCVIVSERRLTRRATWFHCRR